MLFKCVLVLVTAISVSASGYCPDTGFRAGGDHELNHYIRRRVLVDFVCAQSLTIVECEC